MTKNVKRNILAYSNQKYSDPDTDDLLDIASFLDPRFRTTNMEKEKVEHISRAVEGIKSLKDQQTLSQGHLVLSGIFPRVAKVAQQY